MKIMLSLLFLIPGLACASEALDACRKTSTQLDMTICAGLKLKVAEADLEAFVDRYSQRLQPDQIQQFSIAEGTWLAYRDAYCTFEASGVFGGSAHPMVLARCKADLTEEHLRRLQKLSRCREGDYSCPARSSVSRPDNPFRPKPLRGGA